MKKTALPVTDVAFPTITICASGFHMTNVEKAVSDNFGSWRENNGRNDASKMLEDMADYMEVAFQIEPPSDSGSDPVKKTHIFQREMKISGYFFLSND